MLNLGKYDAFQPALKTRKGKERLCRHTKCSPNRLRQEPVFNAVVLGLNLCVCVCVFMSLSFDMNVFSSSSVFPLSQLEGISAPAWCSFLRAVSIVKQNHRCFFLPECRIKDVRVVIRLLFPSGPCHLYHSGQNFIDFINMCGAG